MNVMLDDFLLFVKGDAPWKDVKEFVAHAKASRRSRIAFSTGGTTDIMAITVFAKAIGVEFNVLNFNSGGEALTQLLGGHVQASHGQSAGVHGPPAIQGRESARRVPATGSPRSRRADHEGAGLRHARLPDVARPRHAQGHAGQRRELLGRRVRQGRRLAAFKKYIDENIASAATIPGAAIREVPGRPGEALSRAARQVL